MPDNDKNAVHPNVKARVLPHSDEAERAVLGCVLADADSDEAALTVVGELKAEDFYSPAHAEIFRAMQNLSYKDVPIDLITLVREAEEMGVLEKVGGLTYLTELSAIVTASNFRHYLAIVKKTSLLRRLIAASRRIMDCAYSEDSDDDALSLAEREIYSIAETQEHSALVNMNEAVAQAIETMDRKQRNPLASDTVPIPFAKLNELLGGFHRSDLVLIAARPGEGKTSIGMNFIAHAALDKSRRTPSGKPDPYKCAVFSLEMSAEQLATRLLCSVAKVSMEHVIAGKRTTSETMRIMEAQKKLADAQIYIDDSSLTTPIEILNKCRRLKREHGLDIVFVDYLQLMSAGKRVENRQQEVSEITRTMKIAAKELNVPILLLSQMSRDVEKRDNKKPQMSDLRESGAIEQDADIIIFLYREKKADDMSVDEDTRTKCDLIVAKHRNGRTDTVTVRWHGEYTTFTDLNEYAAPAPPREEPKYATHFSGADEAESGEYDAPLDVAPPPTEAPAARGEKRPTEAESADDGGVSPAQAPAADETTAEEDTAEEDTAEESADEEESADDFDDPFSLPIKGDKDII